MPTLTLSIVTPMVTLFVYMLPAFVAWRRGHRQTGAIAVLNLLLGWTILGWIGALVWACTADVKEQVAS